MQRAAAGTTLVAHCAAALPGAPDAELTRVNVEGTRVLLEAARGAGSRRFLHISSAMVYDFGDRAEVDESTPFRSDGPAFHLSRVRGEEAVWTASAHGLPVTVFRPYVILGAHPTSASTVLLAEQIARGEFIMRGDGSASLPYVHVDSLVEAVVTAARLARAAGQAYNMVDGQTTGREFIDRFCRWLGIDPLPARGELTPWRGRFSGAKARRELGYTAQRTYEEAMLETERYLLDLGIIKR
jgi:nucleoside-diphosphate-sugar epimerase